MNGTRPPERSELPRIEERISFLYVEQCRLEKTDSAVRIITEQGIIDVPAGTILVLMLGPGTTVTHRMVQIASEAGMQLAWVGEEGVRFYAGGSPLSGNTDLLQAQARIVSNKNLRLAAAKKMYNLRYPDDDFKELSMRQLLGREGKKVGKCYAELSEKYGIPWSGRTYNPKNYDSNDTLQNAISCANACLYGVCYAVIFALGLSPGLGIVHNGMEKSFVLDVADIYKESISFPAAFSATAECKNTGQDIEKVVRIKMRNLFKDKRFTKIIVTDIQHILSMEKEATNDEGRNFLWAGFKQNVDGAVRYGVTK